MPFGSVRRGKVERDVRLARMVDWKVSLGIFPLTNKYSLYTRSLLSSMWSSGPRPHWTLVYAFWPFVSPLRMAMVSPALNPFGNLVTHSRQRKERHDPHFEALERGSVFSRCKLDEELAISRYVRILSRFWHLRGDKTNPRVSKGKTSAILQQRQVALYKIFAS
jgi:hypothetical protein